MWSPMTRKRSIGAWFLMTTMEGWTGRSQRWDVYNSEKEAFTKGGYSVEVSNKDGKKVIWEVANNHVVEEGVEH